MPFWSARRALNSAPIAMLVVVLALAGSARGYFETHLDEITQPILDYATTRIGEIDALEAPSRTERKERKQLTKLEKTLAKQATTLANDFAELTFAAKTVRSLGSAGTPAAAPLGDGFTRASIALSERTELVDDHIELLTDPKVVQKVQKSLSVGATRRSDAAAEERPDRAAKRLQQAETAITRALKYAEKKVLRAAIPPPPARLRSGDLVGPPGGRVAIPKDSGTPLAGSSIVFPSSAFASQQVVTISEGGDVATDPRVPAGPTLRVTPQGVTLNRLATVNLRYVLPSGRDPEDLDMLRDDGTETRPLGSVELRSGGTIRAQSLVVGSFQAALVAPPVGVPSKFYTVQILLVATTPSVNSEAFATTIQELEFRRGLTGRASVGSSQVVARQFTSAAPHHSDGTGAALAGSYDFAWTSPAPGEFTFDIPSGTTTVHAVGKVSDDNNVISFSGHGDGVDLIGIGVRTQIGASTSQLAGGWAAAELGVTLADPTTEPFRSIFTDMRRSFNVTSAGSVTYSPAGAVRESVMHFEAQASDPVHVLTASERGDSGAETWTVTADGSLSDAAGLRTGVLDGARGLLVTRVYDPVARTVRLSVAVRQSTSPPTPVSAPADLFRVSRMDITQTEVAANPRSSTYEALAASGSLGIVSGMVTDQLNATVRGVATVTSTPSGGGIVWQLALSAPAVSAFSAQYTFSPDSSGNFITPNGSVIYGLSQDGKTLIGTATDPATGRSRGLVIGIR